MAFYREKIKVTLQNLNAAMDKTVIDVKPVKFISCGYEEPVLPEVTAEWKEYTGGTEFYGDDRHFWINCRFTSPAAEDGKQLILFFNTAVSGWDARNPQGLLYLNGEVVQGLDVNHTWVEIQPDTYYDMMVYFYTGTQDAKSHVSVTVAQRDIEVKELYYDMLVPLETVQLFSNDDPNSVIPLAELEKAANLLDFRRADSPEFHAGVKAAREYLKKNYYNALCGKNTNTVHCVGHTHIDVAWLWTLAQTKEKTQRSFSTVLNLMNSYPEYIFMSSQPQLYKYFKKYQPKKYEELKQRVREGRWEVEGAMWLEADCNLTSGESFVRQIMFGKRFMKEEFGVDSRVLWLPDVFGYSAALPQILKKSGVDKFVTSKISWSETNKMPYDTFMWEGIDGTEIFTQFMTAQNKGTGNFTTYVAYTTPSQVYGSYDRYQQKEYSDHTLITFGHGDGGGGPTPLMLEYQRRLAYGLPGLGKTRITTSTEYLNEVEKQFTANCKKLKRTPEWKGELYLEFHRGTYTSIAKNKKNNRKCELLLQKAEALSAADKVLLGGSYPQNEINDAWETVLLNQFHDILPGSSIKEVYDDCDAQYAAVKKTGDSIVESKLSRIAHNVNTDGGLLVYNPLWFETDGFIRVDGKTVSTGKIPAFGWKIITPEHTECKIKATEKRIENKYYVIKLDKNGQIASLYDKKNKREVLKKGQVANRLELYEDYPRQYDAWEITDYYKQKMWVIDDVKSITPFADGECGGVEIVRRYSNSLISQRIVLYNSNPRIDFVTDIDWKEDHVLLKAAFPFDIHANKATYDIQFGSLERNTHSNTSWDAAKFEVCGHKWADISEDGYGVSLMNDCKYGYSAEGSTLKLSLLKCATWPKPDADKEKHSFTYSLFPHAGDFRRAGTIRQAYMLNVPFESIAVNKNEKGTLPESYSAVSCDKDNVVIETVKKAEDSDHTVVRMYDAFDRRENVTLKFGFDITEAVLCDLMENDIVPLKVKNNTVTLPVKNFEIVTIKVK